MRERRLGMIPFHDEYLCVSLEYVLMIEASLVTHGQHNGT